LTNFGTFLELDVFDPLHNVTNQLVSITLTLALPGAQLPTLQIVQPPASFFAIPIFVTRIQKFLHELASLMQLKQV